ncbi:hypothetical protein IB49_07795 [Geobacillus sp. LC300]|nr:hypothetical protein IB49_07795 [Geobacillus sp. LC300]
MQKWCTFKEANPIIGYRLTGDVLNVIILKQRDGGVMWKFQMSLIYQRKVLGKREKNNFKSSLVHNFTYHNEF